ncbi:beta-1,3-glucosyltransferase [Anastrepha obliqua]|uniref:beta-1,3-glucosyltransferase n=1 Tax=Anastrepha obliqua TaxID=95512 RepID=UPI002409CB4C|nr:beta-1,3-glucosyltransferase [Anastrepha obliqua]
MHRAFIALLVVMLLKATRTTTEPTGVLFLISSQDTAYHRPLAARLRHDIINQAESQLDNTNYIVTVHILHEIFNFPSYWAIKNSMPLVRSKLLEEHTKWVVWLEESTHVSLLLLLEQLALEDATQYIYLGHTLYEHQANIRHHFAFHKDSEWFPFPFQRAGIIFSRALIIKTADEMEATNIYNSPFIIDMEHELAIYIYNQVKKNAFESKYSGKDPVGTKELNTVRKVLMRKAHYICPLSGEETKTTLDEKCAMYAKPMDKSSCVTLRPQNIFFAVKTCKRFHSDRMPIIKATWGRIATHIRYYSDVADPKIPTTYTGIPNTEIGHCEKTLKILKLALQEIDELNMQLKNLVSERDERIYWLVLADDDTLISIPNLCALLGCFNHTQEIYLGERYGFHQSINNGFNYITSGGGVAMSLPAVQKLIAYCHCIHPQDADDMLLGICFNSLEVPIIHSPQFHQLRPQDYSGEVLALDPPISFHKFYDTDPFAVYEQYFANFDRQMLQEIKNKSFTNQIATN